MISATRIKLLTTYYSNNYIKSYRQTHERKWILNEYMTVCCFHVLKRRNSSEKQEIKNGKPSPRLWNRDTQKQKANKMVKPFIPDYERKTIPLVPMIAISFVTLLDNFCNTLVNPIIPYLCKVYFPEVGFYCMILTGSWKMLKLAIIVDGSLHRTP